MSHSFRPWQSSSSLSTAPSFYTNPLIERVRNHKEHLSPRLSHDVTVDKTLILDLTTQAIHFFLPLPPYTFALMAESNGKGECTWQSQRPSFPFCYVSSSHFLTAQNFFICVSLKILNKLTQSVWKFFIDFQLLGMEAMVLVLRQQ